MHYMQTEIELYIFCILFPMSVKDTQLKRLFWVVLPCLLTELYNLNHHIAYYMAQAGSTMLVFTVSPWVIILRLWITILKKKKILTKDDSHQNIQKRKHPPTTIPASNHKTNSQIETVKIGEHREKEFFLSKQFSYLFKSY